MKQNDIKSLPMAFLNAGLSLQVIFLIGSFVLAVAPGAVLHLLVTDYSGGYSMPFDYIHFGAALITTILIGIMYTLLMVNIKKGKVLGLGFGVLLGILAYLTYFFATSITTELVIGWLNAVTTNEDVVATWSLGLEKNVAMYAVIVKCQLYIKFALKTAIILLLIAFGVYAMRNREQNMPKRLY